MIEINGLFIVVIFILAACMFIGYMRGLLGIVFGIASWVFFFVFVKFASPAVYDNLKGSEVEKNISAWVKQTLSEKSMDFAADVAKDVLTDTIMKGLSTAIAAVIAIIICVAVLIVIKLISDAPLLGGANHAAGLLFGVVEGMLVISLLFFAISIFATADAVAGLVEQINNNIILKSLYDHNPIQLFSGILLGI